MNLMRSLMNGSVIAVNKTLVGILCYFAASFASGQQHVEKPLATNDAHRIIALSPHSVELLYVLGAGERIIATTDFADYPAEAGDIPRVGGFNGIQIEKILELNPDLIIAWEEGNKIQDIEKMEMLGLNVYRSQTKVLEHIAQELIILSQFLGIQTQGEKAAKAFTTRLNKIRKDNTHKTSVSFFYQLWDEPLRALAAGSWINTVMENCGGVNVFNDEHLDYPQVSIENILVSAPQAIIIPSNHGALLAGAERWRAWPEIPAVKNEHIFFIEGDLLHRFSTRILDGMEKVCRAFDKVRASTATAVK